MAATQRFFAQALDIVGHAPERVTTDGHDAHPRAIRETLGDIIHRTSRHKNHRIEQGHRGVERRPLLHRLGGATPVLPTAHQAGRAGHAGRAGRRLTTTNVRFVLSAFASRLPHRPNPATTAKAMDRRFGEGR